MQLTAATLGAQLPGVDHITDTHAVFSTRKARVGLSLAMAQFLLVCEMEELRPVLVTGPNAVVSPFLMREMRRLGGSWAVPRTQGGYVDALAGRALASLDEITDRTGLRDRAPIQLPDPGPALGYLGFEITLHHEAEATTTVGEAATTMTSALGLKGPDVWGSTQPLCLTWDTAALTETVRAQMPMAAPLRASTPDGSWFVLRYERSQSGFTERLQGGLPLGPYEEVVGTAVEQAHLVLRALQASHRVVLGSMSLLDSEPEGGMGMRVRRPEVPQALLLGSWALQIAQIDREVMIRDFRAEEVGSQWLPAILVGFPSEYGPPWRQLNELALAVGLENVLAGFAAGGGHRAS